MDKLIALTDEIVLNKIYFIRNRKVMMDRDLAEMYGVETKVLNQAVKRNARRFPSDFMFQMNELELEMWKSLKIPSGNEKMGLRKMPNVFTEQGVAMLSSVLKSVTAIDVNIQIIRIFSRIREVLLTHKDVLLKLEQVEKKMLQQDAVNMKHGLDIQNIFLALKRLLNPPQEPMEPVGFKIVTNENKLK